METALRVKEMPEKAPILMSIQTAFAKHPIAAFIEFNLLKPRRLLFMVRIVLIFPTLLFLVLLFRWLFPKPKVQNSHSRGRSLGSEQAAEAILVKAISTTDRGIQIGAHRFPTRSGAGHIAVVGATGSGKTMIQRLLMQSVLPRIGTGIGTRALVYDAKQDSVGILSAMADRCPIHILNPLDSRCTAWDMAADITCPASALQAAALLIPEAKHDSNPFFTNASRLLVYGALLSCILNSPNGWTLRDVLLTVREPERLKTALAGREQTRFLLQYFEHPSTFQNILSTILTYTTPYEIIAAAWDKAKNHISLSQWLEEESILVLGNDERNRAAIDTINRLIFQRLSELILSQPEADISEQTWLFLDEIREAGKMTGLSRLLTKGRSKGACVVLGFQDISGLREVYGREVADELVGQCNTKVVLRLNSPETASWASKVYGSEEVLEARAGSSTERGRGLFLGSNSLAYGLVTRPVILDSEFLSLPEATPENGLHGYVLSPLTGPYPFRIDGIWLNKTLIKPDLKISNSSPRPTADQFLNPFSPQDELRLGLRRNSRDSEPNKQLEQSRMEYN